MSLRPASPRATAVVYCESNFGRTDGKTANGLVRHSERYEILSVIDSTRAGRDSGTVLGDAPNGIPVVVDLAAAVARAGQVPEVVIFGMAPASGMLSPGERTVLLEAMAQGMDVVNGLHEFLNDDAEFVSAAVLHGVDLIDVRRPPRKQDLRMFTGRIAEVTCPRIAVLGTDGAVGKRTTATVLTRALVDHGIHAVLVSTGQTGLIQGGRYGVALDAIPAQYCAGEMEAAVLDAFHSEQPDVIIIEGQGALSHPAYLTSAYILRGSLPQAVVLQHAPARVADGQFGRVTMPTVESEIRLIETFADTRVIGVTLNHEHMDDAEITVAIARFENELGIPATDALLRPTDRLVDMVLAAFPQLDTRQLVTA
jgi:uncharacterized NAD-dependent epimerase/dehydratase family protein